ncbi:MAG TPA: hypothetical protein PLX89_10630 [Verrucomicrobiota bacterium]|nr:hypothetical protein [Verrucomicrobiales bacterium]HRI13451.1 hypothetical protein [Verrucomicrobiota bacterium]
MDRIIGIVVELKTSGKESWAGTTDHVYLGVVSAVGGREFVLARGAMDKLKNDTTIRFAFGLGTEDFGGHEPDNATASLLDMKIDRASVSQVYIRKQGDRTHGGDNAWRLTSASVILIVSPTEKHRIYKTTGPATFANDYGLQIWLAEVDDNDAFVGE